MAPAACQGKAGSHKKEAVSEPPLLTRIDVFSGWPLLLRAPAPGRAAEAFQAGPGLPRSPCSLRSGAQSSSTTSRRPCSNTSSGMRREIALFCSADIWLLLVRLQIGSRDYLRYRP